MGAAESKLAFRKGVFRLFEQRDIPATADDFWSQFWTVPTCAEDVFSLVTPTDVRRVRDQAPENFTTLIHKMYQRILRVMDAPGFPSPVNSTGHLLNCIRVLCRLIPFVFELSDDGHFERELFWKEDAGGEEGPLGPRLIRTVVDLLFLTDFTLPRVRTTSKSRINYLIWTNGVGQSSAPSATTEMIGFRAEVLRLLLVLFSRSMYTSPMATGVDAGKERWVRLVATMGEKKMVLALLCSLLNTVSSANPSAWNLPYDHMWMPGEGRTQYEVLVTYAVQVLLVLLEHQPALSPTPSSPRTRSGTTVEGAHASPPPSPKALVTQMRRASSADRRFSPSPSPLQRVVDLSGDGAPSPATVEIAQSTEEEEGIRTEEVEPSWGGKQQGGKNLFRSYIGRLHREKDFGFLLHGILEWVQQPLKVKSSFLPGASKQVPFQHEMLMLLWMTMQLNSSFRKFTVLNASPDVMLVLLVTSLTYKLDQGYHGTLRLCLCMLQMLSAQEGFGHALAHRAFIEQGQLPAAARIANFSGTYLDYLIISIHTLITSTKNTLAELYAPMLLTLRNLSGDMEGLGVQAAQRLVQLLTAFASPGILLAEERNHRYLGYLVDTVDAVVREHHGGNANLLYALVRSREKVRFLQEFTLQRGQAELERGQARGEWSRKSSLISVQVEGTRGDAASEVNAEIGGDVPVDVPTDTPADVPDDIPAETGSSGDTSHEVSERAKGKRPALSVAVSGSGGDEEIGMASSQTPSTPSGAFQPTEDWVSTWQPGLGLDCILRVLGVIGPAVEEACERNPMTGDVEILALLRSPEVAERVGAAVGGKAPPVAIEGFTWSAAVALWFQGSLWGQVYLTGRSPLGIWNGTAVKVFAIKVAGGAQEGGGSGLHLSGFGVGGRG